MLVAGIAGWGCVTYHRGFVEPLAHGTQTVLVDLGHGDGGAPDDSPALAS